MSARRIDGEWYVDFRFQGERIRKKSPVDTKRGAEEYEAVERKRLLHELAHPELVRREVPTFSEWFWGDDAMSEEPKGRFWKEWVIANKNKPGEQGQKKSIYQTHLKAAFGGVRLDEIDEAAIACFRASLVEKGRSEKTINNILTVLSKPLRYAARIKVIGSAPLVGLLKAERPEYLSWEFEEYARILKAARSEGPEWYAAVCLAGEAGLRIGEVRALRWKEDVDLSARIITVNQQARHGVTGTPKGRTRRIIPMTETLRAALSSLETIRTGYVVRNRDGSPKSDGQTAKAIYRIYEAAKVEERFGAWHVLRHSFGTHAALLGVNPWTLMRWMGHKRIDETMLYVNIAGSHAKALPELLLTAGAGEADPDRKVITMLGARTELPTLEKVGSRWAVEKSEADEAGRVAGS